MIRCPGKKDKPQCGNEIKESDNFCSNCGLDVDKSLFRDLQPKCSSQKCKKCNNAVQVSGSYCRDCEKTLTTEGNSIDAESPKTDDRPKTSEDDSSSSDGDTYDVTAHFKSLETTANISTDLILYQRISTEDGKEAIAAGEDKKITSQTDKDESKESRGIEDFEDLEDENEREYEDARSSFDDCSEDHQNGQCTEDGSKAISAGKDKKITSQSENDLGTPVDDHFGNVKRAGTDTNGVGNEQRDGKRSGGTTESFSRVGQRVRIRDIQDDTSNTEEGVACGAKSIKVTFHALVSFESKFNEENKTFVQIHHHDNSHSNSNPMIINRDSPIKDRNLVRELTVTMDFTRDELKMGKCINYRYVRLTNEESGKQPFKSELFLTTSESHRKFSIPQKMLSSCGEWHVIDGFIYSKKESKGIFGMSNKLAVYIAKYIPYYQKEPKERIKGEGLLAIDLLLKPRLEVHPSNIAVAERLVDMITMAEHSGIRLHFKSPKDSYDSSSESFSSRMKEQICDPLIQTLRKKDKSHHIDSDRIIKAILIVHMVTEFGILHTLSEKDRHTLTGALQLTFDRKTRNCIDLQKIKGYFPKKINILRDSLNIFIRTLISCETLDGDIFPPDPSWLTVIPLVHFLNKTCVPFQAVGLGFQELDCDSWWGTSFFKAEMDSFRKAGEYFAWLRDPICILDDIKAWFEMDPYLSRVFMASLPLCKLGTVIHSEHIPLDAALACLRSRMKASENYDAATLEENIEFAAIGCGIKFAEMTKVTETRSRASNEKEKLLAALNIVDGIKEEFDSKTFEMIAGYLFYMQYQAISSFMDTFNARIEEGNTIFDRLVAWLKRKNDLQEWIQFKDYGNNVQLQEPRALWKSRIEPQFIEWLKEASPKTLCQCFRTGMRHCDQKLVFPIILKRLRGIQKMDDTRDINTEIKTEISRCFFEMLHIENKGSGHLQLKQMLTEPAFEMFLEILVSTDFSGADFFDNRCRSCLETAKAKMDNVWEEIPSRKIMYSDLQTILDNSDSFERIIFIVKGRPTTPSMRETLNACRKEMKAVKDARKMVKKMYKWSLSINATPGSSQSAGEHHKKIYSYSKFIMFNETYYNVLHVRCTSFSL